MRTWLLLWVAGCGFAKEGAPDLAADLSSSPSSDLSSSLDLASSPAALHVFVTSMQVTGLVGGANGGGLLEADFVCIQVAGGGSWRAWLSDTQTNAIDRVLGSGPWLRMDGQVAFTGRHDQPPLVPLHLDEQGHDVGANVMVWTGTASDGTGVAGANCSDWNSSGALGNPAVYGRADGLSEWSQFDSLSCDHLAHLYCFEQN